MFTDAKVTFQGTEQGSLSGIREVQQLLLLYERLYIFIDELSFLHHHVCREQNMIHEDIWCFNVSVQHHPFHGCDPNYLNIFKVKLPREVIKLSPISSTVFSHRSGDGSELKTGYVRLSAFSQVLSSDACILSFFFPS